MVWNGAQRRFAVETGKSLIATQGAPFEINPCYVGFSTRCSSDIISGISSFRLNVKRALKALCVAKKHSLVLKKNKKQKKKKNIHSKVSMVCSGQIP